MRSSLTLSTNPLKRTAETASNSLRSTSGSQHSVSALTGPLSFPDLATDVLLENLTRKCDLGRVKAISGSAHVWTQLRPFRCAQLTRNRLQNATVLWSTESAAHLANLSPLRPLNSQLTFPTTPSPGVARATGAGAFLASLLLGRWSAASEAEALWRSDVTGEVERFGGRVLGTVSPYFVAKYRFDKDAFLVPFIPTPLASYLAHVPAPGDAVLAFGHSDFLMTQATPNMVRLSLLCGGPIHGGHPHRRTTRQPRRRCGRIPLSTFRNHDVPLWCSPVGASVMAFFLEQTGRYARLPHQ